MDTKELINNKCVLPMNKLLKYLPILLCCLIGLSLQGQEDCKTEIKKEETNNGIILSATTKGTAPFTYKWNTEETTSSIIIDDRKEYCVTVTDNNGCVSKDCIKIGENTNNECHVTLKRKKVDGGIILTINPRPEDKVESVEWSTGSDSSSILVKETGEYCVIVKFTNGCKADKCAKVVINNGERFCKVKISRELIDEGIKLTARTESSLPDSIKPTFEWSTGETAQSIIVNEGDKYCVLAVFGDDCRADACITLKEERDCEVEIIKEQLDEGIKLTARTKTKDSITSAPTFEWSTGETTQSIIVTEREKYCVVAYFGDVCKADACINLKPERDCAVEIVREQLDEGIKLTARTKSLTPNTTPPTFVWSTGDSTQSIIVTERDKYCVIAYFGDVCKADACINLKGERDCEVEIIKEQLDEGIKLTARTNSLTSNTTPPTFVWSTGDSTQSIIVKERDKYCVIAYFGDVCKADACINLKANDGCKVIIQKRRTDEGLFLIAKMRPEDLAVRYLWSTGDTTSQIKVDSAGEYCVKVVGEDCEVKDCIDIKEESDKKCGLSFSRKITAAGLLLTVKPRPQGQLIDLFWNTGDTTRSILIVEPGEYCVEAIFKNGCEARECIVIEDINAICNVEIYPRRTGDGIKLHAVAKPADGVDSIVWSTGETEKTILVVEEGEYCVSVYFNTGCVAEKCVTIKIPAETDSCRAVIRVLNDNNLQAKSSGKAPFEYSWNTGETKKTIKIGEPGEYCVTITDASGCVSSSCVEIEKLNEFDNPKKEENGILNKSKSAKFQNGQANNFVTIGKESLNNPVSLKLSPNPARNQVNFNTKINYNGEYQISVQNMQGEMVYNKTVNWEKGQVNGRILVSNLTEGIYVLKIQSAQILMTEKFIKQ